MTYNISIGRLDDDDDFLSDEEGSSGVHVVAPSIPGSHDQIYDDWAEVSADEIKPCDSASRPRTSQRNRSIHGSRSASARRPTSRRHHMESYPTTRSRRQPSPADSAGSVESDDYAQYSSRSARDPRDARDPRWPPVPPVAPAPNYPPSAASNQTTYGGYPGPHGAYPHPNGALQSDSLVRRGEPGGQPPYGYASPYGQQYQGPHGGPAAMHQFYAQERHPAHQPPPHARMDPRSPQQQMHMGMHGAASPFGASPFQHEMVPFAHNPAFYNYRDPNPYAMMAAMPQSYFPQYPQVPSPAQQPEPVAPTPASPAPAPAPTPAPPPVDTAKDEAIARLEKLIMDERAEREKKEADRLAAIAAEAAEAAAREAQLAHDRKIAGEAAALARADAEKRAAEEAAKAKEEAEKATATAASEAAAAATAAAAEAVTAAAAAAEADRAEKEKAEKEKAEKEAAEKAAAAAAAAAAPPPEKKKPIKFKDAVGRKFSFPFELCATWQGMEDLIKQAFLHIEVIGPHVADGHYDLVGPNGDIILPQVWETVIEPDWSITMHMWPIPEKPKEPEPPAEAPPAEPPKEAAPPPPAEAPKKPPPKKKSPNGQPGGFANWMMGGRKPPRKAPPKKAAEAAPAPAPAS